MLLKLDNPKMFSEVISIISELVTEVRIRVDERGLSVVAIDPANVALVSFKIPASAFSQFETGEEVIGVSLDSLKSVLKRCSGTLVMKTEDSTLTIEIQDKIKRVFNLALINIDSEEKSVPALEFSCRVEMPSPDFVEAIEDCSVVAESSSFSVKEGKFIIDAKGLHSTKSEFSNGEVSIVGVEGKSKYSLEYMKKFTKAAKLSDKVGINFSSDYPLKLDFNADNLQLIFILAPRVENDD